MSMTKDNLITLEQIVSSRGICLCCNKKVGIHNLEDNGFCLECFQGREAYEDACREEMEYSLRWI